MVRESRRKDAGGSVREKAIGATIVNYTTATATTTTTITITMCNKT